MKKLLFKVASVISVIWRLIPFSMRKHIFLALFIFESRSKSTAKSLGRLFEVEDELSLVMNERAIAYGEGEHPKHKLTNYHDFFIQNLSDCKRIIDLGCGYGAVARSIAIAYPQSFVMGIDNNIERLEQAQKAKNPLNVQFQLADIYDYECEPFDAVVLSNVLEHIERRDEFLKQIMKTTKAKKILIRVPNFERHWSIPLRKALGVNYFQDSDHKIEHTLVEFKTEIIDAGLNLETVLICWGEIWGVCMNNAK